MLERQEEYLLAKRWREHGDRDVTEIFTDSKRHAGLPLWSARPIAPRRF